MTVLRVVVVLAALCAISAHGQRVRVDEVPMYGGMDRAGVPDLKAGDDKLIADTSAHYGSREKAATEFIQQGFNFYYKDSLGMAMRRFNQAWLLDPNNPEVYWGFGVVLRDQENMCESAKHFDKALGFKRYFQGMYPDAAQTFALCGVSDKSLSEADRAQLYERADKLYAEAVEKDANKGNVYTSCATANFFREKYADAWAMVKKARETGGQISPELLRALRAKMREP